MKRFSVPARFSGFRGVGSSFGFPLYTDFCLGPGSQTKNNLHGHLHHFTNMKWKAGKSLKGGVIEYESAVYESAVVLDVSDILNHRL